MITRSRSSSPRSMICRLNCCKAVLAGMSQSPLPTAASFWLSKYRLINRGNLRARAVFHALTAGQRFFKGDDGKSPAAGAVPAVP